MPNWDALTTAIFIIAMWLMALKKVEHWAWWILGDIISIPLYFSKALVLTSFQYSAFLILAIMGYVEWVKIVKRKQSGCQRIAITGPESTGKSQLAEAWRKHQGPNGFRSSRALTSPDLDRPYVYRDILHIAKQQHATEMRRVAIPPVNLFCDTDMTVLQIWCEVKYGRCHDVILRTAAAFPYDFTLLCDIDLPWEDDPLREHPHMRQELFNRYLYTLQQQHSPFAVIRGLGEDRLANAIHAIDTFFGKNG